MIILLQISNTSIHLVNQTRNDDPNGRYKMNSEIFVYFVVGFLACASNILLCTVFGRKRSLLQKRYNVIILTLRIFDLLTGKLNALYFFMNTRKIWMSVKMFLIQPIHLLKFLGKSQPQRSGRKVFLKQKVSVFKRIRCYYWESRKIKISCC